MFHRRLIAGLLLLLIISAVGVHSARAEELLNDSVSFTVPPISVPSLACVTINGETKCNPTPATSAITATVTALVTEGNGLTITEGAPATQASGQNCARLAKTVTVLLGVGSRVNVNVVGTQPPINQTIMGPTVPGPLQSNSIELCVNA